MSLQLRGNIQKVTLPMLAGALWAQSFSPPHVSFLLTSADSRPPRSHGPFSVTAALHLVPSHFPVQGEALDWLSVLDPD